MDSSIKIRQAHFPGRAPIDAYGNGGFRFAEMSHRGSILCLPSGIYGWSPNSIIPDINDLIKVKSEANDIEILFIGTGLEMYPINKDTMQELYKLNLSFEIMTTGAAARTFNVLLSEDRAVAAALIAVE